MKNKVGVLIAAVIMVPLLLLVCIWSVKSVENKESVVDISVAGRAELRNTIEISIEEAKNLEINYTSKNVYVYPSDGKDIIIKEYLISDREECKAQVSKENDESGRAKTVVTGGKSNVVTFFFIGEGEKIEIYLPSEGLEVLKLQTGSGNIKKENEFILTGNEVLVMAGSGNIKWMDTHVQSLGISTGSGNIKTENVTADMKFSAGSGNISTAGITGNTEVKTGSGNITLENFKGAGSFEAGSGNIKMQAEEVTGDLNLQTRSGGIKAQLPKESSFQVQIETGSGNIRTSFDDVLSYNKDGNSATGSFGNVPSFSINAKAGSGNVNLSVE